MNTIICNLFAGPGVGKSTVAAGLFHLMKLAGKNVELVTEFPKDLTWSTRFSCLSCQPYVFGEQYYRLYRLLGKVDFIINDSPILLSVIYNKTYPDSFNKSVIDIFKQMNNINFYLNRGDRAYNPKGRSQTLSEAQEIDRQIMRLLLDNSISVANITAGPQTAEQIFNSMFN